MNPYEELANAIILQAVKDYRLTDDERELQEIERFFRSGWFGVLSKVDPEFLIKELRKEKRNCLLYTSRVGRSGSGPDCRACL